MNEDTAALRLQAMFFERPDTDIPLAELYQCAKGRSDIPLPTSREQQQYVGSFVSRINARIEGRHIKPGAARRTYRLSNLEA